MGFGGGGAAAGGGGGGGLFLPPSARLSSFLDMKDSAATAVNANSAAFWTAIDLDHAFLGYDTVKLAAAANTLEQTILDITGEGVLTHVLAPLMSGSGVMTIRVTIDGGEVKEFISETISGLERFCLGLFYPWNAAVADQAYGCATDEGFGISNAQNYLPTPLDAVNEGIGLKYFASLKVTIQASVNITATANQLNGCVNHTLLVPAGL